MVYAPRRCGFHLQLLTKEYYTLQTSLEKRNSELESSLQDMRHKLETYEKLEMELDDVIMQAADSECRYLGCVVVNKTDPDLVR